MVNVERYFKIVLGLLLIVIGVYSSVFFWPNLWTLIKGAVGLVAVLIGLLIIAIAALD